MSHRFGMSWARCVAVLAAPVVALGMMAAVAPAAAASAAARAHVAVGRSPAAATGLAAAPASLQAAIRTTLGAESSAGWSQQAELQASDGGLFDQFGLSLAVDAAGNTALVGAFGLGTTPGEAYVFTRQGSAWTQTAKLFAPGGERFFGSSSVALNAGGTTALIGARGAAYVFTLRGGTWSQTGRLPSPDPNPSHGFGGGASLNAGGTTALILGDEAGYVFTLRGGTWTLTAQLPSANTFSDDQAALNAAGTTAVLGAVRGNGAVNVFTLQGGTWSQTATLTANHGGFGASVAMDAAGNTVLVGAPGSTAADVFTLRGGTWSQTGQLGLPAGDSSTFGSSVGLDAAGTTALVGDLNQTVNKPNDGAAYVFTLQGGTWTLAAQLAASDGGQGDLFGRRAALSANGSTALITSRVGFQFKQGTVYVFAAGP